MAAGTYGTYGGTSFDGRPLPDFGQSPSAAGAAPGSMQPPLDRPPSEHSLLRSGGGHARYYSTGVNVLELIFVPWCLMALILVCYFFAGAHGHHIVLVVIPVILLSLCSLFIRFHYKAGDNGEVVLGLLCMAAMIIALCVGIYGVLSHLFEYHRLSQGASYFNVLPEESAAGHIDATTMVFTSKTRVDSTRVFGFTDARTAAKTTYCVAPVSDNGGQQNRIQYWVAGINCCEARSDFVCSDASNANAHGGLALDKASQSSEGFKAAVRGAQAAYQLTSGDSYLLLDWKADPVAYRDGLWRHTMYLFGIFGGSYFILSAMVGLALIPSLQPAPVPGMATAPGFEYDDKMQ